MGIGACRRGRVRFGPWRWLVIVLLMLAMGCAGVDTAERTNADESSGTGPEGGAPRAFGVDVVDWPTTFAAASTLLKELPPEIHGVQRDPYPPGPPFAAYYGKDFDVALYPPDDNFGWPASALTTLVGEVVSYGPPCVVGTYAGTIPTIDGTGPHAPHGSSSPPAQPLWFSCRLAPTGRTVGGPTVGWVSGNVGWQANARTKVEVQALVNALAAADEASQQH